MRFLYLISLRLKFILTVKMGDNCAIEATIGC